MEITEHPAKPLTEKIIDTIPVAKVELLERADAKGEKKVFVRGEFGRSDKPTANKRLYPKGLWESQIRKLGRNLKERKVIGELDHPSDGRTSLQRGSHVITDLRLEGDLVIGEAEIIPTRMGQDLLAYLKAGVPIGVSSRGYGSTKPNSEGVEVVQEDDYKLVTFDFVADPADQTAYPNVFFEGVEFPMDDKTPSVAAVSDAEKAMAEKFGKKAMEGSATIDTATLREEFKRDVLDSLSALKQEAREEALRDLLADPEVAAAKLALESIKSIVRPFVVPADAESLLREKDAEIAALKNKIAEMDLTIRESNDQIDLLAAAAKEAGYKFYLETLLSGVEDAAIVRKMVGDVTQHASQEDLKKSVDESIEKISEHRKAELAERAKREEAQNKANARLVKIESALEEASETNKLLALQLYAERKLTNHPKAAKIRAVLENTDLGSTSQVDEIIESFRERARSADEVSSVRERVGKVLRSGRSSLTEGSETPSNDEARTQRKEAGDYNGLGAGLSELRRLSGFGSQDRS